MAGKERNTSRDLEQGSDQVVVGPHALISQLPLNAAGAHSQRKGFSRVPNGVCFVCVSNTASGGTKKRNKRREVRDFITALYVLVVVAWNKFASFVVEVVPKARDSQMQVESLTRIARALALGDVGDDRVMEGVGVDGNARANFLVIEGIRTITVVIHIHVDNLVFEFVTSE